MMVSCLFVSVSWAKPAGMRIVYDVTVTTGGEVVKMESKYFIQEKSVRFETMSPSMGPGGKMVMIGKPQAKKYILLMEAQKSYMEMPEPIEKEAAEEAKSQVPFKATGKSKTIAGYSCEVFERTLEGRKEEACASKDLNDVFEQLEKSMPKSQGGMSSLPGGLNGFPLEYVVKGGKGDASGAVEHEMRVTELKRETLSAALFEIPKGYQKMAMPTFEMKADQPKMPKKPQRKSRR